MNILYSPFMILQICIEPFKIFHVLGLSKLLAKFCFFFIILRFALLHSFYIGKKKEIQRGWVAYFKVHGHLVKL